MRGSKARGVFTLFVFILLHIEYVATTDVVGDTNNTIQYYLPRVTIPISYEIKIIPEITEGNFTFYGETFITVKVVEETTNVTLHSKDLRIDENFTYLVGANGVKLNPIKHTYVNATNFLIIQFDKSIATGNYTLGFKFSGNMTNVPEGIFNSSYINDDKGKVSLAATKFTQIHARRSFPCWDEPDLKATFNLSIKSYPNYTVVSNMPERNRIYDNDDDKIWINFQVTPIMSTYLLAFVVSDFECLFDEDHKFNVCGRREVLPYLKHSRDVSQRAMMLLEKYFDVKYNLPKMDQFAVPDATTGATENWGLIIYRESSVAYQPFENPISTKEYVALTVVHELAHQWIGNLVTPETWKYSWIKEGLPTFLQYRIVDKLYPDWREVDMFIVRVIQEAAFNFDNTIYYEPLEKDVDNPNDVRSKFSSQIYNRGAALFHMMSNMLTENTFKSGIRKFIKENEYGSITSDDLWSAMQSAYNDNNKESEFILSIKDVMKPWVTQEGFPIVNVTRDYSTGKVIITQESNLAGQSCEHCKDHRWWIPINFATTTNPNFEKTAPSHWLKPDGESLVIDGIDKDDWIIVNIQQSGYYRVDYDKTNWKKIADYMNSENYEKIHVRNRAQLINDLSYMVNARRQNYTTFLDLARYLIHEDDYPPWLPSFRAIRMLRRTTYNEQVDRELKKFILGLMEKVIKKIGFIDLSKAHWIRTLQDKYNSLDSETKKFVPTEKALKKFYKPEDFLTQRLRAKFLSFACSLGHTECLNSAEIHLRHSFRGNQSHIISPDVASWINCHGALGSEEELLKKVNGSDIKYLGYLGCSPNKTVLRNYVEQVIEGNINATAKQTRMAISFLSEHGEENLENTMNYFIDNYNAISKYFAETSDEKCSPNSRHYVASIMSDLIFRSRKLEQLNKIKDLIKKEETCLRAEIERSIELQTEKIKWSDENAPILGEWLHDHATGISSTI